MPVNWFFSKFTVTRAPRGNIRRTFPTEDFTTDRVRAIELPNNNILLGVKAPQAILDLIAGDRRFSLIPPKSPDAPMSSFTVAERAALRAKLVEFGYGEQEITARLGDLSLVTLRQVMAFAASRWSKPTPSGTWAEALAPEFEATPHRIKGKDMARGEEELAAGETALGR